MIVRSVIFTVIFTSQALTMTPACTMTVCHQFEAILVKFET